MMNQMKIAELKNWRTEEYIKYVCSHLFSAMHGLSFTWGNKQLLWMWCHGFVDGSSIEIKTPTTDINVWIHGCFRIVVEMERFSAAKQIKWWSQFNFGGICNFFATVVCIKGEQWAFLRVPKPN